MTAAQPLLQRARAAVPPVAQAPAPVLQPAPAPVPLPGTRQRTRALRVALRRILFLGLVAGTVGVVAWLLLGMLRLNGTTPLEYAIFVLTTILLVPIVLSFWMALIGFAVERRRDPLGLDGTKAVPHERDGVTVEPPLRTAIAVPVYNEDPARVLAGVRATLDSLRDTGRLSDFDFWILSDTMDPARWVDEEVAVYALRESLPAAVRERVQYRNRRRNVERKAGNIADFCAARGERYRYMIVFDADSVMSGTTLVRMVELMERHPDAGIVQVPPVPVNRRTLFGRLQQFAARAYGPTWAAGLSWLQCGEGNYYGHNAIVRIAPFVAHCQLPKLSGREPLGGSILSHDFVEAALMRRAGWKVWLAADVGGSYEEPPPTLIDFAARDRRWCQGNLQHARLLGMPGLHLVSRAHLWMGVMAYVGSPLWILLLLVSTAEALRYHLVEYDYFAPGGALFPTWRVSIEVQAAVLFALVMVLLFLPRALALVGRLRHAEDRRRFGGALRLLGSGLFEWVFSMLLAPVLALMQSRFVADILLGRSVGWNAQTRGDRGTPVAEAVRRHAGATVLGVLWAVLLLRLAPDLFWWMLPVLAGMVLAVPLSMTSSRTASGDWARRHGLLLTPEEVDPEPVLVGLREELQAIEAPPPEPHANALERVLRDPRARAAHLAWTRDPGALDPLEEHALQGLVLKCRLHGPASLTAAEQRTLLLAPRVLRGSSPVLPAPPPA